MISGHSARATCITKIAEKGANITDLLEAGGHASLGGVRPYLRTAAKRRNAVRLLEAFSKS